MIIKEFTELCAPERLTIMGRSCSWFVAGVAEEPTDVYLHNDGTIHDICSEVEYDTKPSTSGWYRTEQEAYAAAVNYYTSHGFTYTAMKQPQQNSGENSKVMEFV